MSSATVPRASTNDTNGRLRTPAVARNHAPAVGEPATHRREVRCILRALQDLPRGARVLDLPCGAGRLLPDLVRRGFVVTEADASPHMIEQSQTFAAERGMYLADERFVVTSVFRTPFDDGLFDAVVCNRLLHRFYEPRLRRDALAELRRIARGPIVVSFFSSLTLNGGVFHVRNRFRLKHAIDRVPIMPVTLAADARAAGLNVQQWLAPRPGISKQCYAVLRRA